MENRNRPTGTTRRRCFKGLIDCSLLHRPNHFLFHFFLAILLPPSLFTLPLRHSLSLPLSLSVRTILLLSLSLFLHRRRDWFTGWQGRRCPGAAKQWLTTGRTFNEPLWRVPGVADVSLPWGRTSFLSRIGNVISRIDDHLVEIECLPAHRSKESGIHTIVSFNANSGLALMTRTIELI